MSNALAEIYSGGITIASLPNALAAIERETDPKRLSDANKMLEALKRIHQDNAERRYCWETMALVSGHRLGGVISAGQAKGTISSGGRPKKKPDPSGQVILSDIGITKRTAQTVKRLSEIPIAKVRAYAEQQKTNDDPITFAGAMRAANPKKPKTKAKKKDKSKTPAADLKSTILEEEPQPDLTPDDNCEADNKAIESFCRSLVKFFDDNCPKCVWVQHEGRDDSAMSSVRAACSTLRTAKAVLCPACDQEGCRYCKDNGYLPKMMADQVAGAVA